ncbi:unnamed protein product [Hymenolepis diminuta]|uniref:Uncharacterized protein n=1 Tax=Hymenolepis diminuta TaxID=6216 RepID=A0A564ZD93_HYMDI|nr:unnamed protein product [Hymenolepis diminuta]
MIGRIPSQLNTLMHPVKHFNASWFLFPSSIHLINFMSFHINLPPLKDVP